MFNNLVVSSSVSKIKSRVFNQFLYWFEKLILAYNFSYILITKTINLNEGCYMKFINFNSYFKNSLIYIKIIKIVLNVGR